MLAGAVLAGANTPKCQYVISGEFAPGVCTASQVRVAALTPLSMDGMIVAASTTLLADS
jgi:hypothetical protein